MPHSNRSALSLTALALTLTLAACSQQTAAPQPQANAQDGSRFVYDGTDYSWTSTDDGLSDLGSSAADLKAQGLNAGNNMLSDQPWTAADNGWGPIERNMSVGEKSARDGGKLTMNGKTYESGFGVHSNSTMTFNLGGQCSRFISDVGMDDEVGRPGQRRVPGLRRWSEAF